VQTPERVDQAITELPTKIATLVSSDTHVTNPKDQTCNQHMNILNANRKKTGNMQEIKK